MFKINYFFRICPNTNNVLLCGIFYCLGKEDKMSFLEGGESRSNGQKNGSGGKFLGKAGGKR